MTTVGENTLSAAVGTSALALVRDLTRRLGQPVFFAGGTARDLLMGDPPRELDLSTPARPPAIIRALAPFITGQTPFGVFTLTHEGHTLELAAQRRDGPYTDHRRPDSVAFAGMEEDTARRDFTVNALYVNVLDGAMTDLCGGLDDLKARRLRMVGAPDRLLEDAVRPLRLARFAARLGFDIAPELEEAARRYVAQNGVAALSGQRLFTEINHYFTGGGAAAAFALWADWGLLPQVLPELAAMQGVAQSLPHHPEGDVWVHTLLLLKALGTTTPTLGWAALLHDVAKPLTQGRREGRITFYGHVEQGAEMAGQILHRFGAPKKFIQDVSELIRLHLLFKDVPHMKPQRLGRFLQDPLLAEHLALHQADCLASHSDLNVLGLLRHRWLAGDQPQSPAAPPLRGADLLAAGVPPGPVVGRLLRLAQSLCDNEGLTNKEELLKRVLEQAGGGDP